MKQVDVNAILDEWTTIIEKLLKSVSDKNFKNFRRAYSEGSRCFRKIRFYIMKNDIAEDLKKRILSISDGWVQASNPLELWKDEVKDELQTVKQGNKVRSKISKAYSFSPSKSGANLRRKAR